MNYSFANNKDLSKNIELFKNFKFSSDTEIKNEQEMANSIIEKYVQGLKTSDTSLILTLFADDAAALWNEKPSYLTQEERRKGYDDLFKSAKLNPIFVIDKTEIYGNIATIRTHHKVGQTIEREGKKVKDFDREIFVLRKDESGYKIIMYMFNKNKFQGQE